MRRFAEVRFEAVTLPLSAVVGGIGGARPTIERQLQLACALQCAETVGALDRVFEMTVEYLGDRYSFGRPLSSYQALKHRVADDKVWLEACHAIATAAGRAVATGADDAGELVSVAKAVDRPPRHRAHPGLRAAPRRHRRHLGARPAPLPAAGHREPGHLRHCPRSTPSASPRSSSGRRRERARGRAVDDVPPAGPGLAGREHAAGQRRPGPARRGGPLGARAGPAAPALGRRLRRHLLPRRVRRPGLTPEHQRAFTEESLPLRHAVLAERPHLRHPARPRSSTSAPTSRSPATSPPSSRARSSGCSSCPSRAAAPTWPGA